MPYWCAQLEPQRERLALHVLAINGYEAYLPRVREHRIMRQQKVEVARPLFPGYCHYRHFALQKKQRVFADH